MNPTDIVVIIAETLPDRQAIDLMKWWCSGEVDSNTVSGCAVMKHPSVKWWIPRHSAAVSVYCAEAEALARKAFRERHKR